MTGIATSAFLVAGALFAFFAALGLVRMPDLFIRMHSATKAGTLGVGLIMVAVAIHFGEFGIVVRALAGVAFLILTAPVAAHLIGRAAYREGVPMWSGTVIDEWGRRPSGAAQEVAASDTAPATGRREP